MEKGEIRGRTGVSFFDSSIPSRLRLLRRLTLLGGLGKQCLRKEEKSLKYEGSQE